MDGSQKLPQRMLDPVRRHLAEGHDWSHLALGVAGWMRYVAGVDEHGNAIEVVDPLVAEYQEVNAQASAQDRVTTLLRLNAIFGHDLPVNPAFVSAVVKALEALNAHGARAAVASLNQ